MTREIDLKESLFKLKKLMEDRKLKFPNNEKLIKQLSEVKMDSNGNPIPETVGSHVRALLLAVTEKED